MKQVGDFEGNVVLRTSFSKQSGVLLAEHATWFVLITVVLLLFMPYLKKKSVETEAFDAVNERFRKVREEMENKANDCEFDEECCDDFEVGECAEVVALTEIQASCKFNTRAKVFRSFRNLGV